MCDLNDREVKITLLKNLKEMQENSYYQFNKLRKKKINEQHKYWTKKIKILSKYQVYQVELLEQNNLIREIKNEIAYLGYRADKMKERTSDIEDGRERLENEKNERSLQEHYQKKQYKNNEYTRRRVGEGNKNNQELLKPMERTRS